MSNIIDHPNHTTILIGLEIKVTRTESNFAFALHFALYFEFEFALYSAPEAPLYGQTIVQ